MITLKEILDDYRWYLIKEIQSSEGKIGQQEMDYLKERLEATDSLLGSLQDLKHVKLSPPAM